MFKIGDKVRTVWAKYLTDSANSVYANRNAVVIKISHHNSYTTYRIKFDKAFYDHNTKVETMFYDSFQDGLVLRN